MHERIRDALEDMRDQARDAQELLGSKSADDLLEEKKTRLAIERVLEIVGEAARRVPDFVRRDIDVPWTRIVGLRNILIHAYDGVDLPRLVAIIQDDVPGLVAAIDAYLAANV